MVASIKGSGIKNLVREMEWVFSSGQMDLNMRACGDKTKPMERVE